MAIITDFVTSDWHFGHANACGPNGFITTRAHFGSTEEMDETIINAINSVVGGEDTLYHLGDIGLGRHQYMFSLLQRIHCRKMVLIQGNHDSSKTLKYIRNQGGEKYEIEPVGLRMKAYKKVFYLTHYPMGLGERRKNIRSICGHIHEEVAFMPNCLNVGIDSPEIASLELPFGTPVELQTAFQLADAKWLKWWEEVGHIQGAQE